MRINKYLAGASGISRRTADNLIGEGRILVNGQKPEPGQQVDEQDAITIDGQLVKTPAKTTTVILNKPVGYVCSRNGQGNLTVYELLPLSLHELKPVGRLDKNSSGLLLLTNNGELAHHMTHPSFRKTKIYKIALNHQLEPLHRQMIQDFGVTLDDGLSILQLERINDGDNTNWKVIMSEGRNRQIRRTFESLGYNVVKLHRTQFGDYQLQTLEPGRFINI